MTTIGKRIKELRGSTTIVELCKEFGIHKNTLPNYEADTRTPNADFIVALCNKYKVHTDWILLGKLLKYLADEQAPTPSSLDYDYIPMVEAKLSAGGGSFVESEAVQGYYAFRKDWLRQVTTSVRELVFMRIIGDSMSPTLQENDTVLVDTNRKEIHEGKIYAIRYDHTIMVKRLAYRPGSKIIVISDNKQEFEPYETEIHVLNIIGQVIFFSRVLIPEGN